MQPVPTGSTGELYIGGLSVGGGYLNDHCLTVERFLPDPFFSMIWTVFTPIATNQQPMMYKTGDLVRQLLDGNIEYIGRSDFQVKVRGMRVELGEIEAAIMRQNDVSVASCAVVASDDTIFAVAVLKNSSVDVEAASHSTVCALLHEAVRRSLPAYMVPSESNIHLLPQLPLNANGKLDRKALLSFVTATLQRQVSINAQDLKRTLTQLESELLGTIDSSFFVESHLTLRFL